MTLLFPMKDLVLSSVLTAFCITVIFTGKARGKPKGSSVNDGKLNRESGCVCYSLST